MVSTLLQGTGEEGGQGEGMGEGRQAGSYEVLMGSDSHNAWAWRNKRRHSGPPVGGGWSMALRCTHDRVLRKQAQVEGDTRPGA